MRQTALIISILLYALIVGFCFTWRPIQPFFVFSGRPLAMFLIGIILFLFLRDKSEPLYERMMQASAKRWMMATGGVVFAISAYFSLGPLEAVPHVFDDICYLWQARTFAEGRLFIESHPLPEFFQSTFMVNDGKWFSLFQPGWPLFLALFTFLSLEAIVNPILAAIATALTYPIGKRTLGDKPAKLAMAMMAVSMMHTSVSATMLAHTFAFVLTELALLALLRLKETNRLADAALFGASLGWLFLSRALNGTMLVLILFPALLFYVVKKHVGLTRFLAASSIALVFLLSQLAYNEALTGHWAYWPQDYYFDLTEPKKGCHRLGFGEHIGCPKHHKADSYAQGFYPKDAIDVTHKRMGTYLLVTLGWSFLFIFSGLPFLTKRYPRRKYFLLAVFLALVVGYFFFYFHGLWGRYYYEASFAVFLATAAGLIEANRFMDKLARRVNARFRRVVRAIVPALGFGYFAFNIIFYLPLMNTYLSDFFYGVDRRLERLVEGIPEGSIVILQDWYNIGFIFMRPGDYDGMLYVRDWGKHNEQLMQFYPERKFFRYEPNIDLMRPIKKEIDFDKVFIEAEAKAPIPFRQSSGEFSFDDKFTAANGRRASGGKVLTFYANGQRSFFEMEQLIFKTGDYRMKARFVTGFDRGKVKLFIDGQAIGQAIDLYSQRFGFKSWRTPKGESVHLTKGKHRIRIELVGKHSRSKGYFVAIDWIRLKRMGSKAE